MPAVTHRYTITFLQRLNARQVQIILLARINRNRMHQCEWASMFPEDGNGFIKLFKGTHARRDEGMFLLSSDIFDEGMIRNHRRCHFVVFQIELAEKLLTLDVPCRGKPGDVALSAVAIDLPVLYQPKFQRLFLLPGCRAPWTLARAIQHNF